MPLRIVAIYGLLDSSRPDGGRDRRVGGNIAGETRVLTTAIVLETRKGNFALALALGIVLLILTFLANLFVYRLQRPELTNRQ